MVDKIEMSLDDIIKSSKGKRGTARRGRGGNRATGPRRGGGSFRTGNRTGTQGVMRGRNRGGISRQNYTRVSMSASTIFRTFDNFVGINCVY